MLKTEKQEMYLNRSNKKCIIWIIIMHCGIVLDFKLPKLGNNVAKFGQYCLIGLSAQTVGRYAK